MTIKRFRILLLALLLSAGACMGQRNATSRELDDARAAYARAAASNAAVDARPHLIAARQTLDAAEREHRDDPVSARERHLAVLAKQRADLALVRGQTVVAEREAAMRRDELKRNAVEAAQAAEQARAQADMAQQQAQTAQQQAQTAQQQATREAQARAAAEAAASSSRTDLERVEKELADTRAQLAQKGDALDDQTRALRDREVALQAQVDAMRVERDRAEQEKQQLQAQRDKALGTIREFATVNEGDDRGLVITVPAEVMFRTGSAKLIPRAKAKLDELAAALENLGPDQEFVIEGHTDSRGGAAYNQRLSKRRANAVRAYLISQGVDSDRVVARGHGENEPIASNAEAEGRAENRRVEVVVSPSAVSSR